VKHLPQALRALTERATPDHYRRATLMFADPTPSPLPSAESTLRQPVRPSDDSDTFYPWQNLTFEGGGAKGYAYIGAIQALEKAGIYPNQVRRVAGTSVGSMLALFAALGVSSDEMIARVPTDLQALVMDGGGGRVGSMARTAVTRGMHPGQRTFEYLGSILRDYTGSADVTFGQLLDRAGRELCVPVTNVTRMMTEYCHPKTTPNMPVRVAIRMSMSLPVLLQPVLLQKMAAGLDDVDTAEVYVDGGVLCNNPSHAFDGWWLSLAPEDSFLRRVLDLDDAAAYYARSVRFSPANDKTLAFTLFSSDEADLTRDWVRPGGGPPPRPQTPEKLHYEAVERETALARQFPKPLRRLLAALDDLDLNSDGRVSQLELARAVEAGDVSSVELLSVFGTTSISEIFGTLNRNEDGYIEFDEVVAFIQSVGGDLTTQLVGYPARPPRTLAGFAANLFDAVSRDLSRATLTPEERDRTVPICTDYITTRSFDLVAGDLAFLIESARRSTRAFLLDYDAQRAG
jgi:arachidonate 5-lipoxygenase